MTNENEAALAQVRVELARIEADAPALAARIVGKVNDALAEAFAAK